VVKDVVDQICDVLEVNDPSEREEYTLYVITNSGALSSEYMVCFGRHAGNFLRLSLIVVVLHD